MNENGSADPCTHLAKRDFVTVVVNYHTHNYRGSCKHVYSTLILIITGAAVNMFTQPLYS